MSHARMSYFVSFPFFGFNLVIKLRNFDFEILESILIKKTVSDFNMFSQILVCLIWFKLRSLSRTLSIK